MRHYSDPKREHHPHVFQHTEQEHDHPTHDVGESCACPSMDCGGPGWYWQACLPGCLPDGEAMGPFDTEAEALADAREGMDADDDEA